MKNLYERVVRGESSGYLKFRLDEQQGWINDHMRYINSHMDYINEHSLRMDGLQRQIDRQRHTGLPRDSVGGAKVTYSQAGEDLLLWSLFAKMGKRPSDLTYLDLGANYPIYGSNTYLFYEYGATGVLVEANTDLIPELRAARKDDIVLNKAVSAVSGETVDLIVIKGGEYGGSTMDQERAKWAVTVFKNREIEKAIPVETISYNDICAKYLGRPPDLLDIDIEGMEHEVLRTADFERWRPLVVIIEVGVYNPSSPIYKRETKAFDLLIENGYAEYACTGLNSILVDMRAAATR
jgi:FkbM family methyltransferase